MADFSTPECAVFKQPYVPVMVRPANQIPVMRAAATCISSMPNPPAAAKHTKLSWIPINRASRKPKPLTNDLQPLAPYTVDKEQRKDAANELGHALGHS